MLYVILRHRGHFRIEGWLWGRIFRQFAAGALMMAALYGMRTLLGGWFAGSVGERLVAVSALIAVGGLVYFGVAWIIGAMDRDAIMILLRRKKPA
jgi:putative peptidoglycan lipid II flippase